MKNKLWALILYPVSLFTSADWLDVNMPVRVTDISEEVFGLHMAIFFVVVAIGILVFGYSELVASYLRVRSLFRKKS